MIMVPLSIVRAPTLPVPAMGANYSVLLLSFWNLPSWIGERNLEKAGGVEQAGIENYIIMLGNAAIKYHIEALEGIV